MSRPKIIQLTKPVYKISASDFTRLVNATWPALNYDLEVLEESKPGSCIFNTLDSSDLNREYWRNEVEFLETRCSGHYGVYTLMLALLKRRVLKPGHYLIEV